MKVCDSGCRAGVMYLGRGKQKESLWIVMGHSYEVRKRQSNENVLSGQRVCHILGSSNNLSVAISPVHF